MPELPEVETVRRGLEHLIGGFQINDIQIYDRRSLKRNVGNEVEFKKELIGLRLEQFERRGKFLWIPLSQDRSLVTHLGMSGQILVRNPAQPLDKFERIRISVQKARKNLEFRFVDQRLFGGIYLDDLVQTNSYGTIPKSVMHIAPDPLESIFDIERVARVFAGRIAGIKSLIMNQQILSGIGNIYADETLWLSRIHYLTPGASLEKNKIKRVIQVAQEVLSEAVNQGGTSFDQQYKNVNGESGTFSQSLNAYGRTGLPCPRCGTNIKRDAWSNRGSHFCPRCQKPKG